MKPEKLETAAERFFHAHAGYSYDPQTETREAGRIRCAKHLAACEGIGREAGISFSWSIDPDCDSSDWSDETPAYEQWQCIAYAHNADIVGSLGCIDFGRDGSPHGDDYRRVVEAEMAAEYVGAQLATLGA